MREIDRLRDRHAASGRCEPAEFAKRFRNERSYNLGRLTPVARRSGEL
jgi:hypothetical protein